MRTLIPVGESRFAHRRRGPAARATVLLAVLAFLLVLAGGTAVAAGPSGPAVPPPSNVSGPTTTAPGSTSPPSTTGKPRAVSKNATFGVQPANAKKPDARPFFSYAATPGASVIDHVAVRNPGAVPITVALYASDASTAPDGSYNLSLAGGRNSGVGSWVRLANGAKSVTVAPRTNVIVALRLTVPANAEPGDHAGGIVASLGSEAQTSQGDKVNLDQRVASRIYLRVSGPLHPKLQLDDFRVSYHPTGSIGNPARSGLVTMTYLVRNTGNVRLSADQRATVKGLIGGTRRADLLARLPEVLPGSSVQVTAEVRGVLPAVRITATATVTPRSENNASDPSLSRVAQSASLWVLPWLAIGLFVLVVLIGLLRWLRRRPVDAGPQHGPGTRGGGTGALAVAGSAAHGAGKPTENRPLVIDRTESSLSPVRCHLSRRASFVVHVGVPGR
ncbi:MAG: hypothetical protein JWN95_1883 [Frankiales bacterium]|nr:hypothetical protein [Frankiales bacterium]